MAKIRLAFSGLPVYEPLAAAATEHLIAAYKPFGVEIAPVAGGLQLPSDPVTSSAWQTLIMQLANLSGAASPPEPAHVIFATAPPGLDLSINGQLLNETRGLCALYLGASSFQTPSPFKRLDLVAQVLIHEVGHMLNLTHGDAYGYGHADAMMPTVDRQRQAPLPAWQAAVNDAAQRHEPALKIPAPTYFHPFAAQCRACLRDAATNPQWWPWRSRFRDEFGAGTTSQGDFSLSVNIDTSSLPEIITTGDGLSFTLRIRNVGEQPVPLPMHIGPEFGTMSVAVQAAHGDPVSFRPDNYRCSSAKIAVLPGQTLTRSFSLIPCPGEALFTREGTHSVRVELFTTDDGGRLSVGAATASIEVVEPQGQANSAIKVATQLVATLRGNHALPTRSDFDQLPSLLAKSTIAQHARYKLALLHDGDERVLLLKECLSADASTAVRHRAARQLALHLLQAGWKTPRVMSWMRRFHRDERDDELFETLERMGHGWNTLLG